LQKGWEKKHGRLTNLHFNCYNDGCYSWSRYDVISEKYAQLWSKGWPLHSPWDGNGTYILDSYRYSWFICRYCKVCISFQYNQILGSCIFNLSRGQKYFC